MKKNLASDLNYKKTTRENLQQLGGGAGDPLLQNQFKVRQIRTSKGQRAKNYNNTLIPKEENGAEILLSSNQIELTQGGRNTAMDDNVMSHGGPEPYSLHFGENRTMGNNSMLDSWQMMSKGANSPFAAKNYTSSSVKRNRRKRGTTAAGGPDDVKSKISSYRQKYYD